MQGESHVPSAWEKAAALCHVPSEMTPLEFVKVGWTPFLQLESLSNSKLFCTKPGHSRFSPLSGRYLAPCRPRRRSKGHRNREAWFSMDFGAVEHVGTMSNT
eukprot:s1449_g8.t1